MSNDPTTIRGKTAGYKSTEFWVTAALMILAALMGFGVIPVHYEWVPLATTVAAGLAASAFIGSRAGIKKALLRLIEATEKARAKQQEEKRLEAVAEDREKNRGNPAGGNAVGTLGSPGG